MGRRIGAAALFFAFAVIGDSVSAAGQIPASVSLSSPAQTNGTDLVLAWLAVGVDIYGNALAVSNYNIYFSTNPVFAPDLVGHANQLGFTNATQFVHKGALTNSSSGFYYISAVGTNGVESLVFTNMVGKIALQVPNPTGSNVFAFLALPPTIPWMNASSLAAQLGITGKLYHLNDTNQSYDVWDAGTSTGTNFALKAGESYGVELSTGALLSVYGTYGLPISFACQYNTNTFNHHWISVPPNSIYSNAAALAGTIPASTKVAFYDPTSSQFLSWFNLNGAWLGTNFVLNPANGIEVSVTSNGAWQTQPEYPQATVNLQADRLHHSDQFTGHGNRRRGRFAHCAVRLGLLRRRQRGDVELKPYSLALGPID